MKFSNNEVKRIVYIIAVILFVVMAGVIYIIKNDTHDTVSEKESDYIIETYVTSSPDIAYSGKDVIAVYISGAVKKPGVYELDSNSRINDAVIAAGGFRKKADKNSLNLAAYISDGEHIHISAKSSKESESDTEDSAVNINKASKEELMTLPGIGESKANLIIRYRDENNGFDNIEELMNISGIKEGVFSRISELITI